MIILIYPIKTVGLKGLYWLKYVWSYIIVSYEYLNFILSSDKKHFYRYIYLF